MKYNLQSEEWDWENEEGCGGGGVMRRTEREKNEEEEEVQRPATQEEAEGFWGDLTKVQNVWYPFGLNDLKAHVRFQSNILKAHIYFEIHYIFKIKLHGLQFFFNWAWERLI